MNRNTISILLIFVINIAYSQMPLVFPDLRMHHLVNSPAMIEPEFTFTGGVLTEVGNGEYAAKNYNGFARYRFGDSHRNNIGFNISNGNLAKVNYFSVGTGYGYEIVSWEKKVGNSSPIDYALVGGLSTHYGQNRVIDAANTLDPRQVNDPHILNSMNFSATSYLGFNAAVYFYIRKENNLGGSDQDLKGYIGLSVSNLPSLLNIDIILNSENGILKPTSYRSTLLGGQAKISSAVSLNMDLLVETNSYYRNWNFQVGASFLEGKILGVDIGMTGFQNLNSQEIIDYQNILMTGTVSFLITNIDLSLNLSYKAAMGQGYTHYYDQLIGFGAIKRIQK